MAVSADQIAVLEMLLSGNQDYADLDDLFGLDSGETRSRAGAALEEIGGADPDANVGLTDYLLGQADPIGRADAIRHLRQDQADHDLASTIADELVALFPDAEVPTLPAPPGTGGRVLGKPKQAAGVGAVSKPGRPAGEPKTTGGGNESRFTIPEGRGRLYGMLGGGALVLVILILAIAGVFGGGGETAPTADGDVTAQGSGDELSSNLPDGQELTRVPLAPQGNGNAAGAAVVGVTDSDQPYLDLTIENLEPPTDDQVYIAWFMFEGNEGYPMPQPIEPQQGSFQGRIPIPIEAAQIVSRATRIEVSLTNRKDLEKPIQDAIEENQPVIERPGKTILTGDVPQPGAGGQQDQVAPGEGEGQ